MDSRKSTVDCLVYEERDLAVVDVVSEVRGEPPLFPILNVIGLQWDLSHAGMIERCPTQVCATVRGVNSWLNDWHSHRRLWSA